MRLILVMCCDVENDLYRVLKENGIEAPRFGSPDAAVRQAPAGAGVLILADGYPARTTEIGPEVFAQAARKRLRLYVECPSSLPGMTLGPPREPRTGQYGNILERTVVTSDAFAPALERMRIVMIHDGHSLPVEAERMHLAAAHVAGYDTAVFGLPKQDVWPILFEHPRGDILVATTKLSHFVTARYAPTDAWAAIWRMILGWLQPGRVAPSLHWTPAVRPRYGRQDDLPDDAELQTLRRGTAWFLRSRLLVHPLWEARYDRPSNMGPPTKDWPWGHRAGPPPDPTLPTGDGSLGMLEGFRSRILADGSQAVLWWRRHDCNGEVAGAMAMAGAALGEEKYRTIAVNIGDWLYFRSRVAQGKLADAENPAFGLCGWNDVPRYHGNTNGYDIYYCDDNARGLLGMLKAAAALKTDRWDERAAQCLLANLRISSRLGFPPVSINVGVLEEQGWQRFFGGRSTSYTPHHMAYMQACFLWAYHRTGFPLLLERARTAIRMTMAAYPDRWDWTLGQMNLERARFLLPLAWLVRVEDTPEHRLWLERIATDLLADQDACGAILTRIVQGVRANDEYGATETSLIHDNGDPIADLLYTSNFALVGLREAAAATGDPRYRRAEDRLAEFICRVQIQSPGHPELDGAWFRGFDTRRWEYWGADADVGWGLWSVETGWTQAEVLATLVLRHLGTSLWEYLGEHGIKERFDQLRPQMLPDEVIRQAEPQLLRHAAVGKAVTLTTPPDGMYPAGGPAGLVDGMKADPNDLHHDWLGFHGADLEATIDLGKPMPIRTIGADFLQHVSQGIFLPTEVEFSISRDGRTFRTVATAPSDISPRVPGPMVHRFAAKGLDIRGRYLRIRATSIATIPEWHAAAGRKAWLFVDEIMVDLEDGE